MSIVRSRHGETTSAEAATIGAAIGHYAAFQGERPAFAATDFEPLSYAALDRQIKAIGAAIRSMGLGHDARIAVSLPSGPHAAIAITAIACSAVVVPLDPGLVFAEMEMRLALHRPDAVLLLRSAGGAARTVAEQRGIPVIEADVMAGDRLGVSLEVAPTVGATVPRPHEPDALAFIVQTSGTATADAKLVPWTHGSMLAMAERLRAWFELSPADRCLCALPVHYGHGVIVCLLTPLLTGGCVVFPKRSRAPDIGEWLGALEPTWYSGSPTLHLALLEQARALEGDHKRHKLRFIVSGGAPLADSVRAGLVTALGVPVLQHFGCSEAGVVATNCVPPSAYKHDTCGIPWPGTVRIAGEDGRELAAGEAGEVWVGGATLTSGYLDAPALNRTAFVDGWFRTGDIGSLDDEGFLSIHGRIKELINRGGEKVGPVEVDAALMRHPAVQEAAAFAVAHPRLGEDVAAAVILKQGMSLTATELRDFLANELAPFKIPRRIVFLDTLPKGANGKVQRRLLADLVPAQPREKASGGLERDEKLEQGLLKIWRTVLRNPSIGVDDDFFEAGGDSLVSTGVALEIEKLTRRPMPEAILFEEPTVRRLAERLQRSAELRPALIVRCGRTTGTPLLMFHGDYGGRFLMGAVLRELGRDHPIIVVAPHGIDSDTAPSSIEQMAVERLPLVLQAQPEGPYRLLGHCNGSLVAFEVARLLKSAGHKVELVAMIDPIVVSVSGVSGLVLRALALGVAPSPSSYWQDLRRDFLRWAWRQLGELRRAVRMSGRERRIFARVLWRQRSWPHIRRPAAVSWRAPDGLDDQYQFVMARYFPARLDVPVAIFAADYDPRPWRQISPDLEIVELPDAEAWRMNPDPRKVEGDLRHYAWVTEHKAALAAHLRTRIEQLESSHRS